MKEQEVEKLQYTPPSLVEYGDIRTLTSAASGSPGTIDSQYFLGYFNNLGGECDPSYSA